MSKVKDLFSRLFNPEKWKESKDKAIDLAIDDDENKIFNCNAQALNYCARRGTMRTPNYNPSNKENSSSKYTSLYCAENLSKRTESAKGTMKGVYTGREYIPKVYEYVTQRNTKENIEERIKESIKDSPIFENMINLPLRPGDREFPFAYNKKNLPQSRTESSSSKPLSSSNPGYLPTRLTSQSYSVPVPLQSNKVPEAEVVVSPVSAQDTLVHNQDLTERVAEVPKVDVPASPIYTAPVPLQSNKVPEAEVVVSPVSAQDTPRQNQDLTDIVEEVPLAHEKVGSRARNWAGNLFRSTAGYIGNLGSTKTPTTKRPDLSKYSHRAPVHNPEPEPERVSPENTPVSPSHKGVGRGVGGFFYNLGLGKVRKNPYQVGSEGSSQNPDPRQNIDSSESPHVMTQEEQINAWWAPQSQGRGYSDYISAKIRKRKKETEEALPVPVHEDVPQSSPTTEQLNQSIPEQPNQVEGVGRNLFTESILPLYKVPEKPISIVGELYNVLRRLINTEY